MILACMRQVFKMKNDYTKSTKRADEGETVTMSTRDSSLKLRTISTKDYKNGEEGQIILIITCMR